MGFTWQEKLDKPTIIGTYRDLFLVAIKQLWMGVAIQKGKEWGYMGCTLWLLSSLRS